MNFDLHFGSHFIDFEKILEPILLHFNIDVAAHTPVCRMSQRSIVEHIRLHFLIDVATTHLLIEH